MLVAVGVLPQVLLDRHAGDRFRHSMQGLFVMITGSGRVIANWVAGPIARRDIGLLYACAAGLCVIAAGLVLLAYRERASGAEVVAAPEDTADAPLAPAPPEAA